jgi:hypothetical protein
MDKREFLDKWFKDDWGIINPLFREDLDSLIVWAAENVIKGAKGDYRVFVEEKKEEEKWVASAKLRIIKSKPFCSGGMVRRTDILQQEWRCLSPTSENGVKKEWRDVPFEE